MPRSFPPPVDQTLFDVKGNLNPDWQQFLNQLAMNLPWDRWFRFAGKNIDTATDLSLLGAAVNEDKRGGLIAETQVLALLSLLAGRDGVQQVSELISALLQKDAPQVLPDFIARVLAVSNDNNRLPENDALAASMLEPTRKPSTDCVFIVDTHANAANYPANGYAIGSLRWESDRKYLFEDDGANWNYTGGCMIGLFAARPADLGATDAGAQFFATDKPAFYVWDGAAWNGDIINAPTGFKQANAAGANHVLAATAGVFVDRALINTDLPDTAAGAHTITLLKLTGGGANGSITWNSKGVVTAFVDPT